MKEVRHKKTGKWWRKNVSEWGKQIDKNRNKSKERKKEEQKEIRTTNTKENFIKKIRDEAWKKIKKDGKI